MIFLEKSEKMKYSFITDSLSLLYSTKEKFHHKPPDKKMLKQLMKGLERVIFPEYYLGNFNKMRLEREVRGVYKKLFKLLRSLDFFKSVERAKNTSMLFINELAYIKTVISSDVDAIFASDPACESYDEIIYAYPTLLAIFSYRIAHVLSSLGVPLIPKMISERAHSLTGIDISPGAEIGSHFFIDHGTGVVIGKTAVIGDYVKIYQGVTLGAFSLKKGRLLAHVKRHPTIEDNVTIYAGATILGGDTVIGRDSIIGGASFITRSVPEGSKISGCTQLS